MASHFRVVISPLPEIKPRLDRRQVRKIGDAFGGGLLLQIGVLQLLKLRAYGLRGTKVHQPAQELPLAPRLGRDAQPFIFRIFLQKRLDQNPPPFCLMHKPSRIDPLSMSFGAGLRFGKRPAPAVFYFTRFLQKRKRWKVYRST